MKNKNAATPQLKPLPAMLTEEELINVAPEFKYLTPEKRAEVIEFVYELSLVLYNCANDQNFKDGET